MKKIILIGAGGHAHACIDVIEQCKKYSISGLIVKKKLKIDFKKKIKDFVKDYL